MHRRYLGWPIQQRPPQVSAVHVDGQRAYARVRQGEQLELAPRRVEIHQLTLLAWDSSSGRLHLAVRCSAGTYIRSLARDLGALLGCGGALASLRRTEALGFDLQGAVALEHLQTQPPPPLRDPLEALAHLPQIRLSSEQLVGWRCGRAFAAEPALALPLPLDQAVVVLGPDGILAGMAREAPCRRASRRPRRLARLSTSSRPKSCRSRRAAQNR